ncbi:MAG: glycoside hydrolase family 32 protein, partial [Flavobacteriaceae bacterium]|nr:glycoside hydrolase family 32 protein [Flavobacteriaceae bacterium]
HGGVWECPDLFPMRVTGSEETKWVLIQSLNPGSANGGSGTQYFIGDFDGKTFSLDPDFKNQLDQHKAIWLDFGRDNYAGVTWSNIPKEDGRTLFIGWMSNWDYAQVVPTETWRSAMTIARELILEKDSLGYKLKSIPAREFMDHVNYKPEQRNLEIDGPFKIAGPVEANLSNAVIEISFKTDTKANYTFELSNDFGNILKFGLDNQKQSLFIDRQNSGKTEFSQKFASSISYGQLRKMEGELELLIILDKTSIELFAEGGGTVMTEIFFPDEPMTHLTLTASDNTLVIKSVAVGQLER